MKSWGFSCMRKQCIPGHFSFHAAWESAVLYLRSIWSLSFLPLRMAVSYLAFCPLPISRYLWRLHKVYRSQHTINIPAHVTVTNLVYLAIPTQLLICRMTRPVCKIKLFLPLDKSLNLNVGSLFRKIPKSTSKWPKSFIFKVQSCPLFSGVARSLVLAGHPLYASPLAPR